MPCSGVHGGQAPEAGDQRHGADVVVGEVVGHEAAGRAAVRVDRDRVREAVDEIGLDLDHPVRVGEAAQAVGADDAVLLRRLVDAAIFPRLPGGNTNLPVIMIAEKAADLIRAR